jgi:hypothetical protein
MRRGEQFLGLVCIRRGLRPNCQLEIVPLRAARVEFAMPVERVLLVAATDASSPFVEEMNHINDVIRLHHFVSSGHRAVGGAAAAAAVLAWRWMGEPRGRERRKGTVSGRHHLET